MCFSTPVKPGCSAPKSWNVWRDWHEVPAKNSWRPPSYQQPPSNVDDWGGSLTFLGCLRTVSPTPPLSSSRRPPRRDHPWCENHLEKHRVRTIEEHLKRQDCLTKSGMKSGSPLPKKLLCSRRNGELLFVTVLAGNGRPQLKSPMMAMN